MSTPSQVPSQVPQSPGWYPSPTGGQGYWDGQQWAPPQQQIDGNGQPQWSPPQQQIDPNVLRNAMAENRSVWVTNAMAVYSIILGVVGFGLNFLFGFGVIPGGIGMIFGFLAFGKSKKLEGAPGKGLSIGALCLNGAVILFGLVVWVLLLVAMGSSTPTPSNSGF